MQGTILRGIGGFYTVLDDAGEIAEVELAAFAPEGADVSESDYLLAEEEAYITATTRFLIRTVGKDSTYVYTPVTGYQNLPDTYRVDANTSVQYLHVEGNRYFVSCAVICAELPASAPEQFILTKAVNLTSFGDIPSEYRDYNAYYGIVGGELAIMLMDPIMPAKMGALYEEAEISHIGITADGLPIFSCVSAARYENRLTGVVGANGFLQTEGGEILQCADDTKIFLLYQTEEGQWEVSAAASIPEGNADAYILKNEHEQLTEIYLLITA